MREIVKIKYADEIYEIEKEKIDYLFERLGKAEESKNCPPDEITALLKKHKLYQEGFLYNMSRG